MRRGQWSTSWPTYRRIHTARFAPRRTSNAPPRRKKKAVAIDSDAIVFRFPEAFGAQVTAGHLTKNDDGEEDDGIPVDTVAVVLLDRGTGWIALYPKASKSTEHTVEAFQHLDGAKDNIASF